MAKATYLEVLHRASSFLAAAQKEVYGAEYLLLERLSWSKTDWLRQRNELMPRAEQEQFEEDVRRFAKDEPAQYIIGACDFYGRRFKVTPATLIPRPETEELVALMLQNNDVNTALKVLDIGTGTGAIALTLQMEAPQWQVTGTDISLEALAVAGENKQRLGAAVRLLAGDLSAPVATEAFDLIVSNPPYIGQEEWAEMDESVRMHEPAGALFAEHHGLEIYERLAQELPAILAPTGKIYLEIGYRQGQAVTALFRAAFPTKKIHVYQDLAGLDRMVEIA